MLLGKHLADLKHAVYVAGFPRIANGLFFGVKIRLEELKRFYAHQVVEISKPARQSFLEVESAEGAIDGENIFCANSLASAINGIVDRRFEQSETKVLHIHRGLWQAAVERDSNDGTIFRNI